MQKNELENVVSVMKGNAIPKVVNKSIKTLSSILKKRQKNFQKKMEQFKIATETPDGMDFGDKKLKTLALTEYAFSPLINPYGKIMDVYDEVKLNEIFEVFKHIVTEINKVELFIPTLYHFCNFIGVSEHYFKKNWVENGSPETSEVCQRIMDYLSQRNADGYLYGKTPQIAGIYIDKSRYGKMDNVPQVQNNFLLTNTTIDAEKLENAKKKYGIE